jgi:hypothetical protein
MMLSKGRFKRITSLNTIILKILASLGFFFRKIRIPRYKTKIALLELK